MTDYATVLDPATLRFERQLPGPIERVWAYLTESNKRAGWLAAGTMDFRLGGKVELVFRNSELTDHDGPVPAGHADEARGRPLRGRVIVCRPPALLGFTWGDPSEPHSVVNMQLTEQGDQVLFTLQHRMLPSREAMVAIAAAWHVHLAILVDRLTGKAPPGYWTTLARLEREYQARI